MTARRMPRYRQRRLIATWAILVGAYLVLLGPIAFVALSSFDYGQRAYVVFPPEHVTLDAFRQIPARYWRALGLSVELAAVSTLIACLIGIPAAIGIVRSRIPGKPVILAIFRAPLQIPSVVAGVAFLQMYYQLGAATGWYGAGTFVGLVVAHSFVATPYVVGTLVSVLQRFEGNLEEAALMLGATPFGTLRQVTLPLLLPGIYAGGLLAFMISFGEVPMSVFLTGSNLVTFPVEIFSAMQFDFDPTIPAISTLVTLFSLAAVWAVQRIVGLDVFVRTGAAS
jgi:putative spermidine/putrescine transport system permease protein